MKSRGAALIAVGVGIVALVMASGAGHAALPAGFQEEVLASFTNPVGFAFLPDRRILVVEQKSGRVRLVVNGAAVPGAVHIVPDVNPEGPEQGLLGIAVDPAWPERPYVYIFFDRALSNTITISRLTASGDLTAGSSANLSLDSRYDILNDIPDNRENHNGGTLRFGPDGMLYASIGEDADPCAAQLRSLLQGKILRLDVSSLPDGEAGPPPKSLLAPPDNPFMADGDNGKLVACWGLRNPFRFTIDPLTGRLYVADVGANDWEEVSEAELGDNLGWPFREGPDVVTIEGCEEPGGPGSQVYRDPIAWYSHADQGSLSVIGALLYRQVCGESRNLPDIYEGAVFYGDIYASFLRVVKRGDGGRWEPVSAPGQPDTLNWATGMGGISDLQVGPDGAIYVCNLFTHQLSRIVYTGAGEASRQRSSRILQVSPDPYRAGGAGLHLSGVSAGTAQAAVFDALGRRVSAGQELTVQNRCATLPWSGVDSRGRPLAPGVYFVRVSDVDGMKAARVVLLP